MTATEQEQQYEPAGSLMRQKEAIGYLGVRHGRCRPDNCETAPRSAGPARCNWSRLGTALLASQLFGRMRTLVTTLALGLLAAGPAASISVAAKLEDPFNAIRPRSPDKTTSIGHVLQSASVAQRDRKRANFGAEFASEDDRQVADWVVASQDNGNLPFIIVDKVMARVFLFDSNGELGGSSPALLGLARGDKTVPGIGNRPLSRIRPDERTTPAGRFLASLGHDDNGQTILWVDYDAAIALHRVITSNPREHRLARLANSSPEDKRISYGCINVPADFYDGVVIPAFVGGKGIVYVLPETRPARTIFFGAGG